LHLSLEKADGEMARHPRTQAHPELGAAALLASFLALGPVALKAQQNTQPQKAADSQSGPPQSGAASVQSGLPRGKKLFLKDGSFQLVREYRVEGDRIRYYNIDSSQWEEMPASLVDWDKTKQAEADQTKHDAALVKKVQTQEEARIVQPLDIDASIEAAPGVFLPPGEGVFAFDGKAVLQVAPAEPNFKTSKKREIEKVLSPIPIVPSRHSVLIQGVRSKVRVNASQPEFYMRTTEEGDPDLALVPAKVHGTARQIANVDELFKMQQAAMQPFLLQRWEIAKGVYRFTLGQTLSSGEYALVQVVPGKTDLEQLNIYVWDFGVDLPPSVARKTN
jgi:hypothetical protein